MLFRAPAPVLKVLHRRDLKEKKGREEARPDSPSLPLPVLCKHEVFAICLAGGKTSLCSPRAGHAAGQGPHPGTQHAVLCPHSSCCPRWGVPTGQGVLGDVVQRGRPRGEPPLAPLVPPRRVCTPGRRRAHARTHTHTHSHQTNPESGLLSERINYWLMNIQIRNSAEPGGGLALGAALGRRIPPERYKSPLPLRRFPSGALPPRKGRTSISFFFPLPLLHFQSARGPRNYNGLL